VAACIFSAPQSYAAGEQPNRMMRPFFRIAKNFSDAKNTTLGKMGRQYHFFVRVCAEKLSIRKKTGLPHRKRHRRMTVKKRSGKHSDRSSGGPEEQAQEKIQCLSGSTVSVTKALHSPGAKKKGQRESTTTVQVYPHIKTIRTCKYIYKANRKSSPQRTEAKNATLRKFFRKQQTPIKSLC
jgi:hypothetical protein